MWTSELEEFGFGDGQFAIPDEQLEQMLNLDESCLALDGCEGWRRGRLKKWGTKQQ